MIEDPPGHDTSGGERLSDALLAARLFASRPAIFGGIHLRGGGPARDAVVASIVSSFGDRPVVRLPIHVDDDRMHGGIDIAASLALGSTVRQPGLLEKAAGGLLIVTMAERMDASVAGRLAQAIDRGSGFGLVLLDDGFGPDEIAPAVLRERVAFSVDLTGVHAKAEAGDHGSGATEDEAIASIDDKSLAMLAATAGLLGIDSVRALMFAQSAARLHAAFMGRTSVENPDLEVAARLVLAPRATRIPESPDADSAPPAEAHRNESGTEEQGEPTSRPPEDRVLEAALAAIPPDLLASLASAGRTRSGQGGGRGRRTASKLRGRPLSARPGMPRGGARLALIDTLRAAVPWQPLRRAEAGSAHGDGLLIRKADLRVRRFEERATTLTIFCVDASGSAALARLAEAKGAVELMLAQAYTTRSEVALVAFRGDGAELLLQPTRSLTRARRELSRLPGGGGTPLASGITLARRLAETAAVRGSTPFLVFLTDGSANIAADGTPGRPRAQSDALAAAKAVAAGNYSALVVDIAPRPRPEARALAEAMAARYLPLPSADARALARAIGASGPKGQAA